MTIQNIIHDFFSVFAFACGIFCGLLLASRAKKLSIGSNEEWRQHRETVEERLLRAAAAQTRLADAAERIAEAVTK